jgi:hypothetical protein
MQLIRIAKGKQEVIETGDRKKLQYRIKQLRNSTMRGVSGRGGKKYRVTYQIKEAPDDRAGKEDC